MRRLVRLTVALVMLLGVLAVGISWELAYGQDERQAVREFVRASARLAELGIRATGRFEISPGPAGTYVRADGFLLNTETNSVEATGNVVVMNMDSDGTPVVAMRADQVTFEQAFEPLGP